jgi:hypothetical protein
MNTVPEEVISADILMSLSYKDLVNFCQVNQQYKHFCNSDSLWQFLLKRDFAYVCNGNNAKSLYLQYHHTLNYFSPHFNVITYVAFIAIVNYIPEKYWKAILNDVEEQRDKGYYIPFLNFSMLTAIVDDLKYSSIIPFDAAVLNDAYDAYNFLEEIAKDITSCKDYVNKVTKLSLVFMNNQLTTINHDLDMYDTLPVFLDIHCTTAEKRIYNMYK